MTLLLAKTTKWKACRYYGIVVKGDMFKLENTNGRKTMQAISIKYLFNRVRFDLSSAFVFEVPYTKPGPQHCSSILQSRPKILCNPVIPRVIFGIPPPVRSLNP